MSKRGPFEVQHLASIPTDKEKRSHRKARGNEESGEPHTAVI
jgi:hypothetical protein